ncbi:tol-pal system protein YbgF [Thioflavicoccus mobilis 8321]|uniref:Cell division coordinator CpoB n=1 Tax=Thioflavicoccus mobilis 8321 TaxID=765912 RepID=L0GVU2_9GAMM|nr:tol-pal system protein YbgF [Thioflavicoccus mobilis]AGA89424.1 tol-pal system protein YbgF [Thioflavicoccus mobilis 8321]
MRSTHLLALVIGVLLALPAAADSQLEARVARLERVLRNQAPSDLLLEVQRLRQDVQDLRGQVETQQHVLDLLQRQAAGVEPAGADASTEFRGRDDLDLSPPRGDFWGMGAADPTRDRDATVGSDAASGGVPTLPSPETSAGGEREAYQAAFGLLKERRYEDAIAAFEALLRNYPQGTYTDDALFWLGETYYVTRDYPDAIAQYDRLIADYPQSARLPSAMLKVGYIHDEEGRAEDARAIFEAIRARYPYSNEARLAADRLARMDGEGR